MTEPEEREESQQMSKDGATTDALALLRQTRTAALSTLSHKYEGWPFGSVVPYALSARGEPLLLISTIAQHTKNIAYDSRVSLLIVEVGEDVQAHARLTVMGLASKVLKADIPDARARYLAVFPDAAKNLEAHDFSFYRVGVEHVRYIGGFGRIFWLEKKKFVIESNDDPLARGRSGIIEHMNTDHADAVKLYCRAFKGVTPSRATMVGVDQFGFDVDCEAPNVRLRFDFDAPATMESIRGVMVDLVKRARSS